MSTPPTVMEQLGRFADRQPISLAFLTMWLLLASTWIGSGGGLW